MEKKMPIFPGCEEKRARKGKPQKKTVFAAWIFAPKNHKMPCLSNENMI